MASISKADVPRRGRCEAKMGHCTGKGRRIIDPYKQELYGEREWILACENCEQGMIEEI